MSSLGGDNERPVLEHVKQMTERRFNTLIKEFFDFSLYNGNLMQTIVNGNLEPHKANTSNTALVPTPFSKSAYEGVIQIQTTYNYLYHQVAIDLDFLKSSLASVRRNDDFVDRHLEMMERLQKENISERIYMALNRNDYMCHQDWSVLKQVEFNTMSAAASGVNRAANKWHRYLAQTIVGLDTEGHLPDNEATGMLAKAMVKAWQAYNSKKAAIAFFTFHGEFNFADQRSLQYDIQEMDRSIAVVRIEFDDLLNHMRVDSQRRLFINDTEIAIVYYRYGFSPDHYLNEKYWEARYDVERSLAIKCPTLNYVLAGTKRIQQVLAQPGVMEKWLSDDQCSKIRETFIGMHSFAEEEGGHEAVELARQDPGKYVMKPQRDGGGNNTYNEGITEKVNSLSQEELAAYTLMEKIQAPSSENYIVGSGTIPKLIRVVNELGIFGALVSVDGEITMNEGAGFLLRSKDASVLEGGLMRGSSCLDTPWLI